MALSRAERRNALEAHHTLYAVMEAGFFQDSLEYEDALVRCKQIPMSMAEALDIGEQVAIERWETSEIPGQIGYVPPICNRRYRERKTKGTSNEDSD